MATKEAKKPPQMIVHLQDMWTDLGGIAYRGFFGGWAFNADGRQFAMVMKDRLYFRVNADLRQALLARGGEPFSYQKKDRRVIVSRFISAPDCCLDDVSQSRHWAAQAIAAAS